MHPNPRQIAKYLVTAAILFAATVVTPPARAWVAG